MRPREQDRALATRAVNERPFTFVHLSFSADHPPAVTFWCRVCEERLRPEGGLTSPSEVWACPTCNYAFGGRTLDQLVHFYRERLDDVSPPPRTGFWAWLSDIFSLKR